MDWSYICSSSSILAPVANNIWTTFVYVRTDILDRWNARYFSSWALARRGDIPPRNWTTPHIDLIGSKCFPFNQNQPSDPAFKFHILCILPLDSHIFFSFTPKLFWTDFYCIVMLHLSRAIVIRMNCEITMWSMLINFWTILVIFGSF